MPTAGGETSVVVVASRPFGHEHSHLSDASFSAPTRGVGGGGGGGGFGVGECEGRMVAVGHEEPHREEESAAAAAATRDSFETADAIDVTDVTTINPTNNNNKENLDPGRDDGASSNAGVGTGTVGDGHDASEQQAAANDDDDNDDGEAFVPSSPSLSRSSGETTRSEETVESQQPCLFTIDPSRHVERDGDKQPDNRQSLPKDDTSSGSRSEKNPNLHQNDQSSTASTREASHFDVPQIDEPNANDSDASRRADTTQTRDRASSGSSTMQRMRAGMGSALGIDFGSALAADFTPTIQIVEEEDSEDEEDGSVRQASLNAQRQADDDVNEAAAIRSTVRPSSPTAITTPLRQVPPLLCTTIADRSRVPFRGNSCLYPGSTFRGTQTSGRSSYDVEARIVEVDLPGSSVSGYLSISHLTDAHPTLTTFFTGQIVGSKHGFLTCAGPAEEEYGRATEQDDMRHWSRFEHFRKVRNELRRPSLTLRDTVPGMERDRTFLFMRWKERFLVPDHKVKDICGASFAGETRRITHKISFSLTSNLF